MTNLGQYAEQLACDYLQQHKLKLITKNYHCRRGEIDLIMQDEEDTMIFVEVRYRKSTKFGSALESVNQQKQQKIIFTATHYLSQQSHSFSNYRFDVVAITPTINRPEITWIKDAFQLN